MYDDLVRKLKNNERFGHRAAHDRLCAASNGEIWLAEQLLQDSAKRQILSAESAIPNWAKFILGR
eukprot:650104-Pyramimonas_sp.AAC.1